MDGRDTGLGRPLALVVCYILTIHFVFAIRYSVPDQFMFFVPLYWMLCLLAGLGLARSAGATAAEGATGALFAPVPRVPPKGVWRLLPALAMLSLLANPMVYGLAPAAMKAAGINLPGMRRELPFRDNARYWLTPWKMNEDSAERFALAALRQVEALPGPKCVVADETTCWPLRWTHHFEPTPGEIIILGPDRWAEIGRDPDDWLRRLGAEGGSAWSVSNQPGYLPDRLLPYVEPDCPSGGVLYRLRAY